VLACGLSDSGELGKRAREHFEIGNPVALPKCALIETFAALRKMWLRKSISDEIFWRGMIALQLLQFNEHSTPQLLGRAYQLRHNVGAYDAMYVALAEVLQCPLITTDVRLSNAAGVRCEIELLAA